MREAMSLAGLAVVAAGALLAIVTALEGTLSRLVGAVGASLLEHIAAGVVSAVAFLIILSRGQIALAPVQKAVPLAGAAGLLVLIAVIGIAYAMPRIGVTAGNVALVFGQMATAVLIDSLGLLGYERIPLSPARLVGLLLLAAGTYLVLPRGGS